MIALQRAYFTFLLLSGLTIPAAGQYGIPVGHQEVQNKQVAVRDKVSQYCRLDYTGARINAADWSKLQPLVSWPKNPEYPLIDVVSRYEVDPSVSSQKNRLYVTVQYHLLGRFNMGEGYTRDVSSVEQVQVVAEENNGELKIVDAYPNYPHPSRAAMLKWLQDKQSAATDEHSKLIYQHALDELQAQSASPFAK